MLALGERVRTEQLEDSWALIEHSVLGEDQMAEYFPAAYGRLFAAAAAADLPISGPPGAIHPDPEWNPDAVIVETFVQVAATPRTMAPEGFSLSVLPRGFFAIAEHHAGFSDIGDTYLAIGA